LQKLSLFSVGLLYHVSNKFHKDSFGGSQLI
jgi:hypothetical protein